MEACDNCKKEIKGYSYIGLNDRKGKQYHFCNYACLAQWMYENDQKRTGKTK